MIPWLIFAVVIVPLLVIAFVVTRKKSADTAGSDVDDPDLERQFADAEAYEAKWHEEDEERFRKERLP
jgi:hypothetical protein